MKKALSAALAIAMTLSMAACGSSPAKTASQESTAAASTAAAAAASTSGNTGDSANYPTQNVNGIVQWGAGGGTDSLMRPLSALAEQKLGKSIVIQNMTGATGSVATQYVYDAAADGYNLLMGAENPALYDALDISELTYENFDCVYLIGDEVVGIVVGKESPYKSFTEIVEAAKAAPDTIKLSTTGTGGLPWEVGSFITDITGATFNQVPYDSDASAKTAVISGECDFTVCKVQSGVEDWKAGELNYLCLLSEKPVEIMKDVPLITKEYPDFEKYLPWGPFYGVFVKEGTDPAITETLAKAFSEAGPEQSYQEVLKNFNINFLGYTGEEAKNYIASWRENTVSALKKSGAIK
ncbi:Bug family tripartite tricarboxylate transporter substrate binding protein [[Clostridium] aminophilum]|uniref:Tripartite-type tricarboxylate transporter, receptor component TctC n=1 Tax=[Clostridium] aminophilum TaxID=1526 RepID=A0A1I6IB92_9FIRM|nr:tripartite tricarboxylate transporter substrate binding protein [[Clostridium] aminophilum]SFR63650.1 Tripartite-type tricarboxylate transporter, receptor component TctC [[Clostridium] aminophilum]